MAKIFTPVKCKGVGSRVIASAWGQHASFTALAVAREGGTVSFFQEEGDLIEARTVSKYPTSEVVTIAWCPSKPVLAIAWADGTLSIWTDASGTGSTNDDREVHWGKAVTVLQWSPDGSRLMSGDSSGRVSVWKVDPTGRLSTVCTHQRSGAITHCVYKTAKAKSAAASLASNFSVADQPPFYFANDGGAICIADDMGHCNDMVSLGMPLAAMLFYKDKERLVVLTRALVLAQYKVEPSGKMTQVMKVKLSVAGGSEAGVSGCAWLTDGHLATVSAEAIVRVWDLANEDNYVLQLNDETSNALLNERAISIAFHPAKKMLAVGTSGGKIALWTLQAARVPGAPVDDASWRMQPPLTALDGPIRALHWSPSTHLLAAASAEAVAVCAQSTLARLVSGEWALVQLTAFAFVLEHVTSGASAQLATSMRTRGADLWGSRVLLWNGNNAEVHEISTPAGGGVPTMELTSRFHAPSLTLALHKDSVYMISDGRLNVSSLKGVVRSTMPFLEAEGPPLLIHINRQGATY
ncbi:WD40-repeat-containing domain protein [Pavlovales sp. CCMP2436]|nr:WD40-repeat-containing domain protein [Pavlovales sp. CCMP2436]